MPGSSSWSGLDRTRKVRLTICKSVEMEVLGQKFLRGLEMLHAREEPYAAALPFVPVTDVIDRGRVRTSKIYGFCSQGIKT